MIHIDCPSTSRTTTWEPLVGPHFQNNLELRNTDGLMAFFLSDYHPNMTQIQQKLLLQGYRDTKTETTISLAIKFSWEFMAKLHIYPVWAVLLIAARTINVRNTLFFLKENL